MTEQPKGPHGVRQAARLVSVAEAELLCQTTNWVTDLEIDDRVRGAREIHLRALSDWPTPSVHRLLGVQRARDLVAAHQAALDEILRDVERVEIQSETERFFTTAEIRITAHTVYKLGHTALQAAADVLGLILAVLSASPYLWLLVAWTGLEGAKIINTLYSGFERLTDPVERATFETIFKLQGGLAIVNYDALRERDFEQVYGLVSPSTDDLIRALQTTLSNEQVREALKSLQQRGIIGNRDNTWHIRL